jgi:predicted GNAT family acetyltransferase
MPDVVVTDNPGLHRYEARIGDVVAGFISYRIEGERTVLVHTSVRDEWEGHGVGGALARFALDDIVAAGRQITPLCPFVQGYLRRHPEYLSSVDDAHRHP